MKKVYFLICLTVMLIVSIPLSGDDTGAFSALRARIEANFYRGDYPALLCDVEKMLCTYPRRPESFLYLHDVVRFADIYGFTKSDAILTSVIQSLKGREKGDGGNALLLTAMLEQEKLYYRFNKKEAAAISARLGPLRKWMLAGPYNEYGPADFTRILPPDMSLGLDAVGNVKRYVVVDAPNGQLNCGRYLYPRRGIAYAVTSFKIQRPVKLRIYSDTSYQLFINGRKTISNDRRHVHRRCRVVRIWGTDLVSVMLKLYHDRSWKCRVLVTDENDRTIAPEFAGTEATREDYEYAEEFDYPYGEFVRHAGEDPARGALEIAGFFDELDSDEAVSYYRKSDELSGNPVTRYFLGTSLIEYSGNDRSSARYLEGWRLLSGMEEGHRDFIPLQHRMFRKIIDRRDFLSAFRFGRSIYGKSRNYFPFRRDFVTLVRILGYEKEFLKEADQFHRDFPESITPFVEKALYFSTRDINRAVKLYERCCGGYHDTSLISSLVGLYRKQGNYNAALRAITKYDREGSFAQTAIDIRTEMGDLEGAKQEAFREITRNGDPSLFRRLGDINYLGGGDPVMDWTRSLYIRPSQQRLKELVSYVDKGAVEHSCASFGTDESALLGTIDTWLKKNVTTDRSSLILRRDRMFSLERDGGSSVYCEDLIYLNNEKIIDRWGEYKVPFRGTFIPVKVRVYHQDGSHSDEYQVQTVNNEHYINISSLKKGSIMRVAYIVSNPIVSPRTTRHFSIPLTPVQEYRESVLHFRLGVSAPKELHVDFFIQPGTKIEKKELEDRVLYTAELGEQKAVYSESYSGSMMNYLPCYAFSTVPDTGSLARWYEGLMEGTCILAPHETTERFRGGSVRETITKVYDYVAREIEPQSRVLYYPGKASDTNYLKRGTPEDKVILARAILRTMGIASYAALVDRAGNPDTGNMVSPYQFSDVLLYVPFDRSSGLWMDFSGRYYSCGTMHEDIEGRNALVIVGNRADRKLVDVSGPGSKQGTFHVKITSEGSAVIDCTMDYSGRRSVLRKYFRNPREREQTLFNYFGNIIPSLTVKDVSVHNIDRYDDPFKLRVRGESIALATPGKGGLILQPVISKSILYGYIRYDTRKFPLYVSDAIDERESYIYDLPVEYAGGKISREIKVDAPYGSARISVHRKAGDHRLFVEKSILIKKNIITPDEYGKFVEFCSKIKNAEYQTLVVGKNGDTIP
ncbi:MAG TPA: DUF3858 domain-containing protein [Spirochaetota bacterium]|nr:DUF3858 domain-containing protein [Spirochaetota bacterium]